MPNAADSLLIILFTVFIWLGTGLCLSFYLDKADGIQAEEDLLLDLWRQKKSRFGEKDGNWGDRGMHFAQNVVDFCWCAIGPLILSWRVRKKIYNFGIWMVPK